METIGHYELTCVLLDVPPHQLLGVSPRQLLDVPHHQLHDAALAYLSDRNAAGTNSGSGCWLALGCGKAMI